MIKIEQLLPLLEKGWVAMDKDLSWWWYSTEPNYNNIENIWTNKLSSCLLGNFFDIEPAKDWTKSLMRCGDE